MAPSNDNAPVLRRSSGVAVRVGLDDVRDRSVFFVDDVDDAPRCRGSPVSNGWPPEVGIERGAIEGDDEAIAARVDALDRRVKRLEIRVAVVEAVGHRVCLASERPSRSGRPGRGLGRPAARRRTSRRPIRCRDSRSTPPYDSMMP